MKSKLIEAHLPCTSCGSSDALSEYEDGTYCFSCGESKRLSNDEVKHINDNELSYRYYSHRGLSIKSLSKYGIVSAFDKNGKHIHDRLPWSKDGDTFKLRPMNVKTFPLIGDKSKKLPLFGMDKFPSGSAKAVTITEGEYDAASAYQMLGDYPVVSVFNSTSAPNSCREAFDYLNGFDCIYLALDADAPGQRATQQIATLFDVNKIRIVKLDAKYKDANGYLEAKAEKEFVKTWWAAEKYKPKNIIESFSEIEKVLFSKDAEAIAEYPYPTLQEMTHGIRPGEVVLWKALEKIGKTEIIRGIEHSLVRNTDLNIGIIHLEEPEKRSIQGLLSYEYRLPIHLGQHGIDPAAQLDKYKEMVGKEDRLYFYTHFGSDDPDIILDMVRYLVTVCGCKVIFLDHITMIVTGYEVDDERRKLDYISTRLATMAVDLSFNLQLVSHVNDNGQTRGSRNISKVANTIIMLDRNQEAEDDMERNTTKLTIQGNRFAGKTGPAGKLLFDPITYTIAERVMADEPF